MTEKECFKCKVVQPLENFYKHPQMGDGHVNKCKECNKRDVSENYRARKIQYQAYERQRQQQPDRKARKREYSRQRRQRHPEKAYAAYAVTNAIRDGRLIRQPCEVCQTTVKVQAHHDDYSKPLDVRWLCFKHHREHHGQEVIEAKPLTLAAHT